MSSMPAHRGFLALVVLAFSVLGTAASRTGADAGPLATFARGHVVPQSIRPHAAGDPTAPPYAPGYANVVPAPPAPGQSRAGQIYSIYVLGPTGDTVAFTVFEPATLTGGKRYPLVLHSHGFGGSRATSTTSTPIVGTVLGGGNIGQLVQNGYGVISIDERGHGESTGTIRIMDPDAEGQDLLSVMNWAQTTLPWLTFGPSLDGVHPSEPVLGAIGGSYGGGYQLMLNDIDPLHRLHAIVPQYTWHDLNYSLFPNATIKAAWDTLLFAIGNTGGTGFNRFHLDPFVSSTFVNDLAANAEDAYAHDFFGYHSNGYFCDGTPVATNGGPGTAPGYAPARPPRVNAMFFQGMRDTLFTFSEAYANYSCLRQSGGDVRLLSYQIGHNSLGVVPDPGELLFQPPGDFLNADCGYLNVDDATLAFFNEYLKGMRGAANFVPKKNCLSLSGHDAVLVDHVKRGHTGHALNIPATPVVAGAQIDIPSVVDLGYVAGANGDVIGGLPRLEVDVEPVAPVLPGEAFVFAGIGQMRAKYPGIWDLVDNQVTPLRGYGIHRVDMNGIAQRLAPGDRLALLIYGAHDQYDLSGSANLHQPAIIPVTVGGKLWVPLLGPLPSY